MAEHEEGAADLLEGGVELGQAFVVVGAAEKGVEGLLDVGQVVLDFPRHLADQGAFPGPGGSFVEAGSRRPIGRLAGNAADAGGLP